MGVQQPADVVFHNGLVLGAAAPDGAPVDVVAVTGNTITGAGGDAVLGAVGPNTHVVDLDGRTLVPGINDGHLHVGMYGRSLPPLSIDVSPAARPTVRSVRDAIADRVEEVEPGAWIRGHGWSGHALSDLPGAEPSAALLDEVSPVNPVALTDFSGHAVWVNSAAMAAAGITRQSVVPTGGLARRDGAGDFTGLFVDGARQLIDHHVPPPTPAELEAAVRAAMAELHRNGVTSITDAALSPQSGYDNPLGSAAVYELLQRICGRHDVPMRTNVLLTFSPVGSSLIDPTREGLAAWQRPETDERWFAVRGLKIFADGVPPSCTAWMSAPYPDGSHGCLTVGGDTDDDRIEELHLLIREGHDRGLQVGVHATGDRTADAVIDGFAAALAAVPRADPRHYVIHGPMARPEVVQRAGALGVGFNVQPSLKSTSTRAIEALFGRELSEWQWPLRSMVDSGALVASSSDAPICAPNWRHGVASAVLRETPDGEVYGAEQRLTVDETLRSYTEAGAWQDAAEKWKGTIEVRKVADLCVVDARLSTDDPHTFADTAVSLTMVDGLVVHGEL